MRTHAVPAARTVAGLFLSAAFLLAVAACGGGDGDVDGGNACANPDLAGGAAAAENRFANPGFEEGREPWFSKTDSWGTSFSVSDARPHSGEHSGLLELRSDEQAGSNRVYGIVQEISPEEFPEIVSGFYCVERWEQGTPFQYLQFVIIVHDAENIPAELGATNHQIRYILAGAESQPTFISNARYVMVTASAPNVGEWVPFEFDVEDDFLELWGDVPHGYQKLAFFFEVRWDGREPTAGISVADVYYDDLYAGPAQ